MGSTEQRQHLGEDEGNALRRTHDALLREQIGRTGGDEVKHLGDGLMVKFSSSIEALDCAVAIQQAVHRHNEQQADAHRRLDVRVGVHVGEPEHEAGDYFGSAVDIAKRLCDSAEGGQIVVSDLVRGIAGSRGSYTYQSIGALPLKGIAEPLPASVLQWTPSTVTAGAGPAPAQLPLPPLLAGADRTPFVGRERELEAIERGWERAKGGRSQLMLLAGEAGIGKTRLAAQFAAAAHDRGASVLYGRCDEGSVVRCQPFVEALRQVASGALAGELADAFQDDDDRERFALFERVTRVFREQPLAVLVLDDLHWADAATLQLLRFCFTSSAATSLFCIGTYRDTEVGRSHPLAELLADLRRARLGERIPLSGLDHEASRRLIEAASTASASPDVARVLHERTEGNPFFLEELLRDLAEEHSGDLPATVAAAAADIPEGVKDVIVRRLARLSDACNNVLTIAAVIGREFGIDALTRASALPPEQLEESLEDAVAARLVDEAPGTPGHYAFSHALTREALYDELSTTRRVRLHGQTLQYADNEGVKLAYEVLGATGPYVVAVGISNCAAGRPRDRAIAQHWDRVSQSCRLILYDRRGLGFSAAPDRGYSVVASMGDLRAVLDAAGAQRAILWGAADGGPLAIAFAVRHRDRVSGLLLLGTSPKLMNDAEFDLGINPAVIESFLRVDAIDRGRATEEILGTRHGSEDARAIMDILGRVPEHAWSKILGGIAGADVRSLLAEVRVPTLIVQHPENSYIPVESASYLHDHIVGSELLITEDYGAVPHFGETFYRAVERFIEQVTAQGAP